jgi:hypothetical protein
MSAATTMQASETIFATPDACHERAPPGFFCGAAVSRMFAERGPVAAQILDQQLADAIMYGQLGSFPLDGA